MSFIRIYEKTHTTLLDELYQFDALKFGAALNDIATAEFSISLGDPKCIQSNLIEGNIVEIIDDSTGKIKWGGMIAGQSFDDPNLKINCVDNNKLLTFRRLRAAAYTGSDYGTLSEQMLVDALNARPDYPLPVSLGTIGFGAVQGAYTADGGKDLWAALKEFNDPQNYDYWIDTARKFNFSIRRGANKPYYTLQYGTDADNIVLTPNLAHDLLSMSNSVFAQDSSGNASASEDATSAGIYGLIESSISNSSSGGTLQQQTDGLLQKTAYPVSSFSITAVDSTLCPFSDIDVGDSVTVYLAPYFGFNALLRILAWSHDEAAGQRQITVGNAIYKPQAPVKRLYKG